MELRACGGGFQGAGSRGASRESGDAFDRPSREIAGQWPLYHGPSAFGCAPRRRPVFKTLPVGLPVRPWLVTMLTLKNRTLSPVVERFMECARDAAEPLAKAQTP